MSVSISSPFVAANPNITPHQSTHTVSNAAMNSSHPPLLKLPLEMLWETVSHLPDLWSIASLCRVNKQLHSMVEHQLYVRDAKSERPVSLQWAVRRGILETASKAIAAGTRINDFLPVESPFGNQYTTYIQTPLSHAVIQGQCDMAVFLLQNGAEPNVYRRNADIPLHLATQKGYIAVMKLCLEKSRKEINMMDRESLTPLGHALKGQKEAAVRFLIRQDDIVVSPPNSAALDPVVWACRSVNIELLKLLLEKVATISKAALSNGFLYLCKHRSNDKLPWVKLLLQTPVPILALYVGLSQVCQAGLVEVAREIIDSGHDFTNVSLAVEGGQPRALNLPVPFLRPVHAACEAGQTASLVLLHEKGFDLETLDEHGLYPLHYASASGNMETIQLLLHSGIESDVTGPNSHDSLDLAVKRGRLEAFEYFLNLGLDPLRRRADGSTLLHRACQAGQYELIERLFELNILVHAQDNNGLTAFEYFIRLHFPLGHSAASYERVVKLFARHPSAKKSRILEKAFRRESLNLMRLILEFSGRNGRRELNDLFHNACKSGSVRQMRMLIKCGATMSDVDREGYFPIHHVVQPNGSSVAALELCIRNGASVSDHTRLSGTILRRSIREIYGRSALLSLRSKGVPNEAVEHVRMPLHWACMGGHERLAKVLCIHGADVNGRDGEGMTPLHHACESASHACAKLLLEGGCDVNAEFRDADGKTYNALMLAKKNKYSRIPGLLRRNGAVEIDN